MHQIVWEFKYGISDFVTFYNMNYRGIFVSREGGNLLFERYCILYVIVFQVALLP